MGLRELQDHVDVINQQMARYGVKFGIYKNGSYNERLFPFDPIPRIIEADEFQTLERGLAQRVNALNKFLADIYADKNIIHEGVVPEEFVYRSPGYLAQCEGIRPPEGIYSHISGIDLVKGKNGVWYVLEDNLRIPSGASYPLIARSLCRQCCPQTFRERAIRDNRGYGQALKAVMDHVNCGGINVILTPGRYNSAYFEHSYLAEQSEAVLAESMDLYVENNCVFYRSNHGPMKVGAIYRRLSDDFLDPLCFRPDSLIGVPNLMAAYRAGSVAILNTPGNGVADDKGIYYFVPKMIRYYLDEIVSRPEAFPQISSRALERELSEIRRDGYAISYGDYVHDSVGIGAPVFNAEGKISASLGIIAPISRVDDARKDRLSRAIQKAARDLSYSAGYAPA